MLVKLDASMILKAEEQSAYSAAMSCLLTSEFKAYGSVRYQHTSKQGPSSRQVKAHCSALSQDRVPFFRALISVILLHYLCGFSAATYPSLSQLIPVDFKFNRAGTICILLFIIVLAFSPVLDTEQMSELLPEVLMSVLPVLTLVGGRRWGR